MLPDYHIESYDSPYSAAAQQNFIQLYERFIGHVTKAGLERVEGIEPSYEAWKATALPLSYTRAAPELAPRAVSDKPSCRSGVRSV